ncbi:portal protein [Varunaivibrio sulfuroxidans]|uniref:Head-to-tail connecting protein n=1 Tax=Varunaivibrio sulfuroxidans TaxID=1773489 RepID=A0A4R3J8B3_9PROT|nr:portal protein [Varunaivibrio sulfuroxidans]TCS61694.1 head-to-tail connecting protein [Varunaivibrio sulfuroxidans]WES32122.1 portal protein [Varunaivibrio sulfuroxidans]
MHTISPEAIVKRYRRAKEQRATWEGHWRECYAYALPHHDGGLRPAAEGGRKSDTLFDATAADAVDQLAASLLANLTPPWSRWVGLKPGPEVGDGERDLMMEGIEQASTALQTHFDRSNFTLEMHQCFLDLITAGTASLLMEEAPVGDPAAFTFSAVPLNQVVFEESPSGRLDTTFRRSEMTLEQMRQRFKSAGVEEVLCRLEDGGQENRDRKYGVVEAVIPDARGFSYFVVAEGLDQGASSRGGQKDGGGFLATGHFARSPFINFRWLKAPGEIYGRSPVMKALPDIKTANKVVELVLKNASIAVTGIWQADDDGVLNPANITLAPGTIIPKAVGSAGLTPLSAPGRFDISQIVLDDMRGRIRHALLSDRLGQINAPKMSATEVLERSAEMARILGATYGRLQTELLSPLVSRGAAILRRRGVLSNFVIDGRFIDIEYKSPLARQQAQSDAQNTMHWLGAVSALGAEGMAVVDSPAVARWLARTFGVPDALIKPTQNAFGPELDASLGLDGALGHLGDLLASVEGGGAPTVSSGAAADVRPSAPTATPPVNHRGHDRNHGPNREGVTP